METHTVGEIQSQQGKKIEMMQVNCPLTLQINLLLVEF